MHSKFELKQLQICTCSRKDPGSQPYILENKIPHPYLGIFQLVLGLFQEPRRITARTGLTGIITHISFWKTNRAIQHQLLLEKESPSRSMEVFKFCWPHFKRKHEKIWWINLVSNFCLNLGEKKHDVLLSPKLTILDWFHLPSPIQPAVCE